MIVLDRNWAHEVMIWAAFECELLVMSRVAADEAWRAARLPVYFKGSTTLTR